jgi:nicotinamidase-related amidase
MLEKSAALAAKARSAGVKVFHAPITFMADASDNPNKNLGILGGCAADSLFTEGTWNADFHPLMAPADGDVIILSKKGLDAFPGTDLKQKLISNYVETLVLCGFLTNCYVESTMRSAYEKGFNVVTLTDATATTSSEGQAAATGGTFGMFSRPMSVAELEAELSL